MSMMEREPDTATHLHVIPVDPSFGPGNAGAIEAFRELCIFGQRLTFTGKERWHAVSCRGGCENLEGKFGPDGP